MNPRCMPKSFDVRVAERLINRGVLTKEELVSHIESLPDLADQAARCETVWPGEPEPEEDDSEEQ